MRRARRFFVALAPQRVAQAGAAFQAIHAKATSAPNLAAYKAALGEAQKKIAEDCVNAFLFQLPNVTVADARLKGLSKNAPIFVNDLSEMSWR